jgi:uncharacterized membrane protein YphA (DoxX/SURF4 family)
VRVIDWLANFVESLVSAYRADARFLGVVRILFALYVLAFPIDWMWTTEAPAAFFQPRPGAFGWLDEAPPREIVLIVEALRIVLAVCLLLGFHTTYVSLGLSAVMMIVSGVSYSFGKVDHFILIEILPIFMAFAGWGAAYSLDRRRGQLQTTSELPVLLWGITIGFAMLTAAEPKARSGWLDLDREATRALVALDLFDGQKVGVLAEWLFRQDVRGLWKFFDYTTVFAEGWLLVAILVPVLFRCGLLLIMGMHLGIYLILGIDFLDFAFVYGVFFAPWITRLVINLQSWIHRHRSDGVPAIARGDRAGG